MLFKRFDFFFCLSIVTITCFDGPRKEATIFFKMESSILCNENDSRLNCGVTRGCTGLL